MQLLPMASSPDGLISAWDAVITKTPGGGGAHHNQSRECHTRPWVLAHQCVTCQSGVAVISSALCAICGEHVAVISSPRAFALCPRRSIFPAGGGEQPCPPTRPTGVHGGGAMRQRILGSHTPPCHRRMVITTTEGGGRGGLGPKRLCTKNGPTRFSLLQNLSFPTMVTLVGGGGVPAGDPSSPEKKKISYGAE